MEVRLFPSVSITGCIPSGEGGRSRPHRSFQSGHCESNTMGHFQFAGHEGIRRRQRERNDALRHRRLFQKFCRSDGVTTVAPNVPGGWRFADGRMLKSATRLPSYGVDSPTSRQTPTTHFTRLEAGRRCRPRWRMLCTRRCRISIVSTLLPTVFAELSGRWRHFWWGNCLPIQRNIMILKLTMTTWGMNGSWWWDRMPFCCWICWLANKARAESSRQETKLSWHRKIIWPTSFPGFELLRLLVAKSSGGLWRTPTRRIIMKTTAKSMSPLCHLHRNRWCSSSWSQTKPESLPYSTRPTLLAAFETFPPFAVLSTMQLADTVEW